MVAQTLDSKLATVRLRAISRTLTRSFTCILVLFPVFIVAAMLLPQTENLRGGMGFAWLDVATLTMQRRVLLAALVLLFSVPHWLAFARLRGLFSLYADGIVFAAENVARMRAAGAWLIVAAFATIFSEPVLSVVASWTSAQRHLSLSFHGDTLITLLTGSAVYAIAYVMSIAHDADQERAQFV